MSAKLLISRRAFAGGALVLGLGRTPAFAQGFAGLGMKGEGFAAVIPGTEVLQLFYRGQDDGVWSRWRNTNGSWSAEQNIGGRAMSIDRRFVAQDSDVAQRQPLSL